jgi:RNA polymerase sigma-70 factor (ECF subfamily)
MLALDDPPARPASTLRADAGAAVAHVPEGMTFEQVFADCAPFAFRALRRLGVRDADVDDVCQEVFLVVHRRLDGFEGRSSIRTWVYGICLRVASDYRRRAYIARERPLAEAPEREIPASQHDDLERREALAWLDGVLDGLDDAKRAAFVLYEIEQLPIAEVAAAARCPIQTAYARLYAARKHVEAAARRERARSAP